MLEKDIENLIARFPEEFFPNSSFTLVSQQYKTGSCFADLVFEDKHKRMVVLEIKRGILTRDAAGQIIEYYGLLKKENPDRIIGLILCANMIPPERKLFLEQVGIECKELGIALISEIAKKHGYVFLDSKNEEAVSLPPQKERVVSQAQAERSGSRAWIFQANPFRYDVLNALSDSSLDGSIKCWLVNQHRKEIKSGDVVFIWMSGKESGIYAMAEIICDPTIMKAPPEDDKFWIGDEDRNQARLRVKLKTKNTFLNNPLFRTTIKATPGFENLSILKYFQGANFPVTDDEYRRLLQLLRQP